MPDYSWADEIFRNYHAPTMEEEIVSKLVSYIKADSLEDDLATVLHMLKNTNWEPLIREEARKQHERARKQADDINNTMVDCHRCHREIRLGELVDLGREYWKFSGSGCCPECAEKIQAEYRRVCAVCGVMFVLPANGAASMICSSCRTPVTIKEERRVTQNLLRAAEMNLSTTLTLTEWLMTVNHFNSLCAYCQSRPLEEMDHFIPLQAGGGTTFKNCVPACETCNGRKNRMSPEGLSLTRLFPNGEIERVRLYLDSL